MKLIDVTKSKYHSKNVNEVKARLSRTVDRARKAYDRYTTELLRQNILVGSTNQDRYLYDLTGNRRFWPVRIRGMDIKKLTEVREQLWAEAVVLEALIVERATAISEG